MIALYIKGKQRWGKSNKGLMEGRTKARWFGGGEMDTHKDLFVLHYISIDKTPHQKRLLFSCSVFFKDYYYYYYYFALDHDGE